MLACTALALFALRVRRAGDGPPEPAWLPPRPSDRWACVVIHHSATAAGSAATFDAAHRARGWDGLGYHFVIGNGSAGVADGAVEVGPRWVRQSRGAHCLTDDGHYNDHGIGVCLVGNFDAADPTPAQMASLTRLVRHLSATYRIPADRIYTHGGVTGKTRCPGARFDVEQVRRVIAGGA